MARKSRLRALICPVMLMSDLNIDAVRPSRACRFRYSHTLPTRMTPLTMSRTVEIPVAVRESEQVFGASDAIFIGDTPIQIPHRIASTARKISVPDTMCTLVTFTVSADLL